MHIKRRKHVWPWVVLALVLLCISAAAAWILWPQPLNRDVPSAKTVEGKVHGMAVELGGAWNTALLNAKDAGEQKKSIEAFVKAAVGEQTNALFVRVLGADGALYRGGAVQPLPALTQYDNFLFKHDALKTLCDAASGENISVYALFDGAKSADASVKTEADYVMEHYAIAGVYWQQSAVDGAIALLTSEGQSSFVYAGQEVFTNPSKLFMASVVNGYNGAVIEGELLASINPSADAARAGEYNLLRSVIEENRETPLVLAYAPTQTLALSYPANEAKVTSNTCWAMGTSDPAQPLLFNDMQMQRANSGGYFGVLLTLDQYENTFTFTQGETSVSVLIYNTLKNPALAPPTPVEPPKEDPQDPTSGETTPPPTKKLPHDGTAEALAGQKIATKGWITSLLTDPSDDGNINETVRAGATATVVSSVETVRSGRRTWAYLLSSGDYVLAYNTTWLPAETPVPSFTSASAVPQEWGEILAFAGSGSPLAYTNAVDNTLVLSFPEAKFAQEFAITNSNMLKNASVEQTETGAIVTLSFDAPLWGHSIEYAEGTMMLHLKKTPVRSAEPGKPLTGVKVLLDAGHGADDSGAMGVAGASGPMEKDMNLAVTLAAKYRLEQLGAIVATVRTDDTFLTLTERNALITSEHPDFFIAVHHNSVQLTVDVNQHSGTECYYFYDAGEAVATSLVNNVTAATNRKLRGTFWGYYYVARNTMCPSVLLELGFMVNPVEYSNITNETEVWKTGNAIAQSVLENVK